MRKILIALIMVVILVFTGVTVVNGIQIGNNFNKNKMITKENFPKFQYILKKMHWYDSSQVHDNPENERARKIIEKINKGHQLVNQANKK